MIKDMKIALCTVLIIGLSVCAPNIYAENGQTKEKEYKDLSREKKVFRNYSGEGSNSVSSFCMEGYVFVIVSGDRSNFTSIVQVYEDMKGKVAPKKCD